VRGVVGGKYLDSVNRTADGSIVGQWASSSSVNQQWTIVPTESFYKVINRANGKALDTGGQTADGTFMQFWPNGTSNNQQWTFELVSTSTSLALASSEAVEHEVRLNPSKEIELVLAKPSAGVARVTVLDKAAITWVEGTFEGTRYRLNVGDVPAGRYVLRVVDDYGLVSEREILIKP
jgi:hypothetical protein